MIITTYELLQILNDDLLNKLNYVKEKSTLIVSMQLLIVNAQRTLNVSQSLLDNTPSINTITILSLNEQICVDQDNLDSLIEDYNDLIAPSGELEHSSEYEQLVNYINDILSETDTKLLLEDYYEWTGDPIFSKTFEENKSCIIDEIYVFVNDYIFPKDVTLIFKPEGGFISFDEVEVKSNCTTIIADPINIFGVNLKVRGNWLPAESNMNSEWLPWISNYFYSEWFEKDTSEDNEYHDDGIEINKVGLMNYVPLYEFYNIDQTVNPKCYSDPIGKYPVTDSKLNYNAKHSNIGTLKLLAKNYFIKQPIIVRGFNILGSGRTSSTINCIPDGNWDIKRPILLGTEVKDSDIKFIWKRAAIYYPSIIFSGSNSMVCFSDFILNLNGCNTHGIIMERVQDGTNISRINFIGVNKFYSALRIEPKTYKEESYYFDENYVPVEKSNFGSYGALSEGILIDLVYAVRLRELDSNAIHPEFNPITRDEFNRKYVYDKFIQNNIVNMIFPTLEEFTKLLSDQSDLTEYEVFTPNGHNTGVLVLIGCNETTISSSAFSVHGRDVVGYNMTGVSMELIDCNRVNIVNGGAGACRIGCLVRMLSSDRCSGINYTNNMHENIGDWIFAAMGAIDNMTISGEMPYNASLKNYITFKSFYLGNGRYNLIIDLPYNLPKYYYRKDLTSNYNCMITSTALDGTVEIPYRGVINNNNFDPRTHVILHMGIGEGNLPSLINIINQIIETGLYNSITYDNDLIYILTLAKDHLIDVHTDIYGTLTHASSIFSINDGGKLTAAGLGEVKPLVDASLSNYVLKSEIADMVELLILAEHVTQDQLKAVMQEFMSLYPEYDISFENDKLTLRKNGNIVKQITLPYVKQAITRLKVSCGLEKCLGRSCNVD